MVVWFRLERWSVWIFLKIENPLYESAFETGTASKPAISLNSLENLACPSRFLSLPTSHQNNPALGFILPSAALYSCGVGRSVGDDVKSGNSSRRASMSSELSKQLRKSLGKFDHSTDWKCSCFVRPKHL